jgi:hypothetical protein
MVCERILQAITKQYDQRHAFSQFMWTKEAFKAHVRPFPLDA